MEKAEAIRLCESIRTLIASSGPGDNPAALREALSLARTLGLHAPPNLRLRLTSLTGGLRRWFGPRKWNQGDGGDRLRSELLQDIGTVEGHWDRTPGK